MEEINDLDINELDIPMKEVPINVQRKQTKKEQTKEIESNKQIPINCLRNERVIVRYLPRVTGIWGNNPKHVLAGGMSENASRVYVVPRLASSGMYVNVLTDSEKAFLEEAMGLEYNALSIYKKTDNFWDDSNESGIGKV